MCIVCIVIDVSILDNQIFPSNRERELDREASSGPCSPPTGGTITSDGLVYDLANSGLFHTEFFLGVLGLTFEYHSHANRITSPSAS